MLHMTLTEARAKMSTIITHIQNPNQVVILTRHNEKVGAFVSMENLKLIWQIEDEEEFGKIRHPLNGTGHKIGSRITMGRNGKITTKRQAAREVRTLQLTRAEERRILREGGLEPVENGEVAEEREVVVEPKTGPRWWLW